MNKPRPSNYGAPSAFQPQPLNPPVARSNGSTPVPHVNVAELETKPMEELFELAQARLSFRAIPA